MCSCCPGGPFATSTCISKSWRLVLHSSLNWPRAPWKKVGHCNVNVCTFWDFLWVCYSWRVPGPTASACEAQDLTLYLNVCSVSHCKTGAFNHGWSTRMNSSLLHLWLNSVVLVKECISGPFWTQLWLDSYSLPLPRYCYTTKWFIPRVMSSKASFNSWLVNKVNS